jgi:hypothetical protein
MCFSHHFNHFAFSRHHVKSSLFFARKKKLPESFLLSFERQKSERKGKEEMKILPFIDDKNHKQWGFRGGFLFSTIGTREKLIKS